jgi:hypothetical protein
MQMWRVRKSDVLVRCPKTLGPGGEGQKEMDIVGFSLPAG